MKVVRDHLGREITVPTAPRRVISLCPSQTETLLALGVGERLVGRTKFCIHPREAVASIAKVGGTKLVDMDRLEALLPDLVIAEKEENTREMVEAITTFCPVYVTHVVDVPSALQMINDLGRLTQTEATAYPLIHRIDRAFNALKRRAKRPLSVLYLIWQDPFMAAGNDTYIDDVLQHCRLRNTAKVQTPSRYPELTPSELQALAPDLVLLSSEPFPFKEKHRQAIQSLLPNAHVELVDGEKFSWYGARMLHAVPYLQSCLERWYGVNRSPSEGRTE